MLDSDLAELYGVETKALIQAVKRNSERFPSDFMFQLEKRYDHQFKIVFDAIRELMAPPPLPPKRRIGF